MPAERFPRISILYNPGAGGADDGALARMVEERPGWCVELTESDADLRERVARVLESGAEVVVAAGGDGTVHSVAGELLRHDAKVVFGVLPMGTANDFSRSLGVHDFDDAVGALVTGTTRYLDVARARHDGHEAHFVNVASGGLAPRIADDLDSETKTRWGALAYARSALGAAKDSPVYELSVQVDYGPVLRTCAIGVLVANGRACGGGMTVAPVADLEDGLLDVVVLRDSSWVALAALAARMKLGEVETADAIERVRGRDLRIDSSPPMPFVFDGEASEHAMTQGEFSASDRRLEMIVGPEYQREPALTG